MIVHLLRLANLILDPSRESFPAMCLSKLCRLASAKPKLRGI